MDNITIIKKLMSKAKTYNDLSKERIDLISKASVIISLNMEDYLESNIYVNNLAHIVDI